MPKDAERRELSTFADRRSRITSSFLRPNARELAGGIMPPACSTMLTFLPRDDAHFLPDVWKTAGVSEPLA